MNISMRKDVAIVEPEAGDTLAVAGGNYRVVISGEMTGGNYAVIEMLVPPGGGPPPHAHPNMQEMFYVLEGEVEFKTENGSTLVRQGGFINIPLGGAVHCFKNESGMLAKLLCTVVPAGLEEIFRQIGIPAAPGEFIPPPPLTPERKKLLTKLDIDHQQHTYPADYLDNITKTN